jgi:ABC-type transport system involved in cytochrome c biogenesis permease subunit
MDIRHFQLILFLSLSLWVIGIIIIPFRQKLRKMKYLPDILVFSGVLVLICYIVELWVLLQRPPMRTLGETRLWYALFLSLTGIVIFYRWKLYWMLIYTLLMSALFLFINYLHPEVFDKTLMPALQSPWFIPHVIVYMIAYALLVASSIIAARGLVLHYCRAIEIEDVIRYADNIVYMGFAFLTFGLLFGALWAKEAWGHYWTWDPKETWAFLTWLIYLIYMHLRLRSRENQIGSLQALILAMIILLIAWFGVNYLASTQSSIHTY